MQDGWRTLGLAIVVMDVMLVGGTILAILRYVRRWKSGVVDISNGLFLLALVLGQPVLAYQNLLFLQTAGFGLNLRFSLDLLKLFFLLGSLAIICYNLQFLLLEGFPLQSVLVLTGLMGLGIGGMMIGLQLDLSRNPPIFYTPMVAGQLYNGSLMLFNLVGLTGLSISVKRGAQLHLFFLFAAILFFIGPVVVFLSRIVMLLQGPVNLLALPFILPSLLLLLLYWAHGCGFQVRSSINALVVMDAERHLVLGGYHPFKNHTRLTLDGMTFMAARLALEESIGKQSPFQSKNFVHLTQGSLMALLVLSDGGEKLGRFCIRNLLGRLQQHPSPMDVHTFSFLVANSFFSFFGCDLPVPETFFVHVPV